MTSPKHIALVGCGFAGTSAFFQLVDRFPVERITIFEATGDFGPGFAYRTDESPDYLINNPTDTMCLVPSNRRAFVEWLKTRSDVFPDIEENGHLPRPVYGRFLKEVFAATRLAANIKGIRVDLVPHEVVEMTESGNRVTLVWSEGEVDADIAILTTGRAVEYKPFPMPPAGGAHYYGSHINAPELDDIPLDATVHVMGASLSAYDVLSRLYAPSTGCRFMRGADGVLQFVAGENQRHAVLCSRSGRLKGIQTKRGSPLARKAFTPDRIRALADESKLDLSSLRDLVLEDAQANGAALSVGALLAPYQDCKSDAALQERSSEILERAIHMAEIADEPNFLVDFFADVQTDLWDVFAEHLLSAQEELAYRKAFESAVLCYAAPCPLPTAERILALIKAGRLRVVKGARDVNLTDTHVYSITHDFGTERAEILVNTIGAVNRDITHSGQDNLTCDLFAKGYIRPYARNGVTFPGCDVDMSSFRTAGAQNIYIANMMLWGPGFFTSSTFMMATVVERLLENLFNS
jgi:uncharacterized NAD(P)/FAD-binding protein YdhS